MMQSLLPALYPILKENYALTFGQIGILTFTFQVTASLLQPVIGVFTDKRPQPYSLAMGMGFTFVGLLLLSRAASYPALLTAAALVGMGSAVLHPESSRVARMAAGGRPGLAQSLFQMGGNVGSSIGPLAAVVVLRFGQHSVAWFALAAVVAMVLLFGVGRWYVSHGMARMRAQASRERAQHAVARASDRRAGDPHRADGVEVRLHGEHVELLHVLSHRPLRGRSAADAVVRLSRVGRDRHRRRRRARRPVRPQVRHLVLDSRGVAVHAGAAVREPVLDRRVDACRSA